MENWWNGTDGKTEALGYRDFVLQPTVTQQNSQFVSLMETLPLLHNCFCILNEAR
jgi:hypothetical protein